MDRAEKDSRRNGSSSRRRRFLLSGTQMTGTLVLLVAVALLASVSGCSGSR